MLTKLPSAAGSTLRGVPRAARPHSRPPPGAPAPVRLSALREAARMAPAASPNLYISSGELAELLREDDGAGVLVVDVRDTDFNQGGHIRGALNVPAHSIQRMASAILEKGAERGVTCVVVHCMFSMQRGPFAARVLRAAQDVGQGSGIAVRVLDGGYSSFAATYGEDSCLVTN